MPTTTMFPVIVRFLCSFVGWLVAYFLVARLMYAAGRMDEQMFGQVEQAYRTLLSPVPEMTAAAATTWAVVAALLAVQAVAWEVLFRRWASYRPAGAVPARPAARA